MVFNNTKNIDLIVELLKKHGISRLVINPGGTNIALVKRVQDDEFFKCYSIVDERSAAYFSIGMYLQTAEPIGLICTSAQATRNFIPGLTEAFYKKVPLLAITMEKHPRFKYQGYMQAPDQTSLPNDCVKQSFELPYITDINDVYHSRRLINEAMLELTRNGRGPVQLCVPWLDFKIDDIELSNNVINRYPVGSIKSFDLSDKKILIAVGEHRPFSSEEQKAIDYFCENTNSVVYTNHLSNFSNKYSVNGNLILSSINDGDFEQLKPDILISIGGQTGDYPFYTRFSKTIYPEMEHWLVTEDGKIKDMYDKLTIVFQGEEKAFFLNVQQSSKATHPFFAAWNKRVDKLARDVELPFSNIAVARSLSKQLPKNSVLQLSILNSLRSWNLFDLDESIECYSNVGAFGIDGGMSTLIGQSVSTNKITFLVIGDLAFFYDMNSLGIKYIKNNLRILLINNDGGVEFKLHGEDKKETDRFIAAAGHFRNAKGWAETCGFKYLSASCMEEFEEKSTEFVGKSESPILFELFIDDTNESVAYHKIIDANRAIIGKERAKGLIKKVIGKDNIKKIKKIWR